MMCSKDPSPPTSAAKRSMNSNSDIKVKGKFSVTVEIYVIHFCFSVDSLTCNQCNYGLGSYCLSNTETNCSTNTSVCFSGNLSMWSPTHLKAHTLGIQYTLHNSAGMTEWKSLQFPAVKPVPTGPDIPVWSSYWVKILLSWVTLV